VKRKLLTSGYYGLCQNSTAASQGAQAMNGWQVSRKLAIK